MKSYGEMSSVPKTEEYIGTGDAAIYNTVAKMKKIISESSKNPYIREWARRVVANVTVNDRMGEARAVFSFVQNNVRYTRDPMGFEYLQTPPTILEDIRLYKEGKGVRPAGDCDDMTMLSLSLLKSIGFPVAIKTVGFNGSDRFSHVYGLVQVGNNWIPFDCVRPDKDMGWEAPGLSRVMETMVD